MDLIKMQHMILTQVWDSVRVTSSVPTPSEIPHLKAPDPWSPSSL